MEPNRVKKTERNGVEYEEKHLSYLKIKNSRKSSTWEMCNLCKEFVSRKDSFESTRFGILDSCDHIFCLSCIRNYRETIHRSVFKNNKGNCREDPPTPIICPVCKVSSVYIMSSRTWIRGPSKKAKLVKKFKESVKTIPCEYIKCGQGTCLAFTCYTRAFETDSVVSHGVLCKALQRMEIRCFTVPKYFITNKAL
ncbi:E3 ubiquitin-protein ligase makorin-2-like [Uloborus diversus]|uniref:E3 ubiquitin-protein ligase makorin-2-like n=1 Tax=Uloborus diversus TaxID=327109 RepID=UPI0024090B72|nr:E3 ubiquitin-protein ligase makorin-2-like [Uloborus diversus]